MEAHMQQSMVEAPDPSTQDVYFYCAAWPPPEDSAHSCTPHDENERSMRLRIPFQEPKADILGGVFRDEGPMCDGEALLAFLESEQPSGPVEVLHPVPETSLQATSSPESTPEDILGSIQLDIRIIPASRTSSSLYRTLNGGRQLLTDPNQISDAKWDEFMPIVRRLYMYEGKTLSQVMSTMSLVYNFKAR